MADTITAACAGKTFQHHEHAKPAGHPASYRWECPACGDTGNFEDFTKWLVDAVLSPLLRLQSQALSEGAVVLLPSDGEPGYFGQFYGHEIYRVRGIDRPMVALPGA